jgi:hypothetical protein
MQAGPRQLSGDRMRIGWNVIHGRVFLIDLDLRNRLVAICDMENMHALDVGRAEVAKRTFVFWIEIDRVRHFLRNP